MAPSDSQNHSDQALILNKEVYRHVRQRRRRRRGGGSVQSQLEVQQIDTLTAATRSAATAAGTGKGIDYATTPFLGKPPSLFLHLPYDHQLYCSMAGFALLRWVRKPC
jgi:hypothetical protein